MRKTKTWLIVKALLIVLFVLIMFLMPVQDGFRKWIRFIMLSFFVVSFIIDLNKYKKDNA